jgi:hypothetical protein
VNMPYYYHLSEENECVLGTSTGGWGVLMAISASFTSDEERVI